MKTHIKINSNNINAIKELANNINAIKELAKSLKHCMTTKSPQGDKQKKVTMKDFGKDHPLYIKRGSNNIYSKHKMEPIIEGYKLLTEIEKLLK